MPNEIEGRSTQKIRAPRNRTITLSDEEEKYLIVQNRITWEREKGRGARANWKSSTEDIWFCTRSNKYTFNIQAVKVKRRVIAPYTNSDGEPKDWKRDQDGDHRLTHPSN